MPPAMDIAGTANLLDSLRNLRRRVKVLTVARGAGIVLAAAVGLIVAVVGLDYLLQLPTPARLTVNLVMLGVLGFVLYRYMVRPALSRLSLSDLAGQIEHTFPQFDDSLRSTVNFMGQDVPGSAAMQRMTVERASRLASEVDLKQAVAIKPVWGSIGIGLGAVALLALCIGLADDTFRDIATKRLFAGSVQWPKRVEMEMVGNSPSRVPAGQDVAINLKLKKGTARQATISSRVDNGPWQSQVVTIKEDGTFGTRLPTRLEQNKDSARLQIRIAAGDDLIEVPQVLIVPPLELRSAIATVTPPAYIGTKPEPVPALDRTLDVPVGSEVAFTFDFNRPLDVAKGVTLIASNAARPLPAAKWAYPRNGVAIATLKFAANSLGTDPITATIAGIDVDGFENRSSPTIKINVREDGKPSITIENPAEKTEDRAAGAYVPLRGIAEDDFGFNFVELVVKGVSPNLVQLNKSIRLYQNGSAEKGIAWELASDSTPVLKRFTVGYQWELKDLGVALKAGDRLEYYLRGQDNYALDGKYHDAVESEHHILNIISDQEVISRAEAKASAARQQIDAIKRTTDVAKSTAQEQAQEAREQKRFDDPQRATAARLADQQASSAAQTKQVAKQLAELAQTLKENRAPKEGVQKAAEEVAKKLDATAEQPMKEAANELNQAKEGKTDPKASPQQKQQQSEKAAQNLDNAAKQQEQASQQLEQAMNQLNEFGGLQSAIEQVAEKLRQQKAIGEQFKKDSKQLLGKNRSDLTPEQKQKLDDVAKKQEDLAKETEAMLNKMDEKADSMQKADPAAAKAMKQAAQTGKQKGIPQKQSNKKDQNGAAEQMQQNQQANAQQKQKEIELGLEQMLEQLKEAERRQLEKLVKDLAEVKKLIDELVFRQANHNIDDLVLQDATLAKFKEIFKSQADLDAILAQAQRDPKKVSEFKADVSELIPQQEQTHRNTQLAAEKAKTLPDATPAGKLNAAATKMEQAAVYLRKSQLAEAYQPPQVEALKSLLEAKKMIDEANQKAKNEEQEKKEEAIRQAYVKLLEEQKKLDAETLRLDKSKDADGNLKRDDAITLRNLPAKQGELAETAVKIGEKLVALDSVVYAWANKEVVTNMKDVKDDLAKPQTDEVVQAQQTQIEEQLDAMIKNLAKKPPEKPRFDKPSGGGGSGQGKKPPARMPTEAELRLLRDNQLSLNKATTAIDAAIKKAGGQKDAQKLANLGGRQGTYRGLLDQLIQKASKGEIKLGEEPDDKMELPEEANAGKPGEDPAAVKPEKKPEDLKGDVEDQEFLKNLMADKVDADGVERVVRMLGDRMGRSRQRLALKNDPTAPTQEIQKRIVADMENLIALAQQQQQQQGKPKPGEGDPQASGEPKPGDGDGPPKPGQGNQPGQPQPNNGQTAAADSSNPQGGDPQLDLSKELEQKMAEWGIVTGRDRGPARGSAAEKHSPKYDKYISDYYKELSKKAAENK